MTTLREAVREYLNLRRSLGFKLHESGRLLLAFVKFMEEHRSSYITTRLALAWAQQPSTVQPAEWARRLSVVRTSHAIIVRPIHARRFRRRACCRIAPSERDRTCTRPRRSGAY